MCSRAKLYICAAGVLLILTFACDMLLLYG